MNTRKEELEALGYRALALEKDVPKDHPHALTWEDRPLALYHVEGRTYATDGLCPHAAGPIAAGDLEGFEVICPLHGWSFDIRDGRCTNV
ncbi:MAG: Rieske 2Fe-2S domain-containing protein, partial [Deltaproteobacteria bacterium]|nr:Rieske 2Fe-2S domain-containing protein [Deltaproteobacteria bacterium]